MTRHRLITLAFVIGGLFASALIAAPQNPAANNRPEPAANLPDLVAQMMKFDKDGDGQLTKAEITDTRLVRLFNRADADKDGTVTKKELEALDAKEQASSRSSFGGPGGPGGPMGGGPGGPMGGPPKPGEVLSSMFRNRLNLTAEQQEQLDVLQHDVDARMDKILTDGQKVQLKEIRDRGPFGPPPGGGRPGRGGFGGPGGPGGPGRPGDNGFPPPPPQ